MPSNQYRKSHCGDKMVIRLSYLHSGILYTGNMASLYWINCFSVRGSIAHRYLHAQCEWKYIRASRNIDNNKVWNRNVYKAFVCLVFTCVHFCSEWFETFSWSFTDSFSLLFCVPGNRHVTRKPVGPIVTRNPARRSRGNCSVTPCSPQRPLYPNIACFTRAGCPEL